MTFKPKPIETEFMDIRYRSRLEARWAIYFFLHDWKFEYEKEGYDLDGIYYLPDFWLPDLHMWAEVKAEEFTPEEIIKCKLLHKHTGHPCLMLVGHPDTIGYYDDTNEIYALTNFHSFGRLFAGYCGSANRSEYVEHAYVKHDKHCVRAANSARFEFGEHPLKYIIEMNR